MITEVNRSLYFDASIIMYLSDASMLVVTNISFQVSCGYAMVGLNNVGELLLENIVPMLTPI